ncbi:uncharacterized protein L969DRAFT_84129 [Mixia osmundae IAM 14324]|uniref:FAM50A/XAP5 C-terminal domain-containing protein n=1 Tax=Mixia osmundae (strain CBS 9802 / IAM 14324 / JCM 22182 / KY 12970) TaxID=764103 RepID=G7E0C1_MIXOS|nr:uncharacterized protein L969DRAFT_84129 [Mixia osmundae IAM 14324]KEI42273.1 hypothetical protein L969DRAFT_84129 [Mixia osmundae IAM 14324]GAA96281.1 hypothetical protein E5Q_02947 [Mixia osmundae IAM 14324]
MSSLQESRALGKLEKQRERLLEDIQRQKDALAREANKDHLDATRFVGKTDSMEDSLKMSTVGLQRLSDFQLKRQELEEQKMREAAKTSDLQIEDLRRKKKKKDKKAAATLSFAAEDEAEQDEPVAKKPKLGKNPTVDTSFLPDRVREEAERKVREELRQEWLRKQEMVKEEEIVIIYSYWDGSGHRKDVTMKKGDTIAQFLAECRKQVPELRATSVDNLMYIKEDLIIPHHYRFYDFIMNKARGKSGPLFSFDVHDDVRLVADATIEKEETHAGKVVERAWYNRNRHVFPQNRWETYEPDKDYGAYRIKDAKLS